MADSTTETDEYNPLLVWLFHSMAASFHAFLGASAAIFAARTASKLFREDIPEAGEFLLTVGVSSALFAFAFWQLLSGLMSFILANRYELMDKGLISRKP